MEQDGRVAVNLGRAFPSIRNRFLLVFRGNNRSVVHTKYVLFMFVVKLFYTQYAGIDNNHDINKR